MDTKDIIRKVVGEPQDFVIGFSDRTWKERRGTADIDVACGVALVTKMATWDAKNAVREAAAAETRGS